MDVIKVTKAISFLAVLFMLFSCEHEQWIKVKTKTKTKINTKTLGCTDYLSVTTPNGTLYNNVWNKKAAGDQNWSQCLVKKSVDDKEIYGWSWSWPIKNWPFAVNHIYAYPQIKLGNSPWDPKPNTDERFPLKISALNKLNISHDIDINTNGQHNLATSMWLVDSPTKLGKSSIMAELMIWTYSTPEHFNPAGKLYGIFKTDKNDWEVWVYKNWGDISGENDNKWTYITFRAKNSNLKNSFNALELIQYAIEKDIIKNELYISDIELGTEIMSGTGNAWVNSFNVDFN